MNYARWLLLIFLAALAMFGVFAVISLRGPATPPTQANVTGDSDKTALFPQQRAIDGYTLEVEPEVGAAKDHRERRGAGRSGR